MHEAKLRQEESERMRKEIQTIQDQHQRQLQAAQKAAENSNMWRDIGHVIRGVASAFLPMGKFSSGLSRVLR